MHSFLLLRECAFRKHSAEEETHRRPHAAALTDVSKPLSV